MCDVLSMLGGFVSTWMYLENMNPYTFTCGIFYGVVCWLVLNSMRTPLSFSRSRERFKKDFLDEVEEWKAHGCTDQIMDQLKDAVFELPYNIEELN